MPTSSIRQRRAAGLLIQTARWISVDRLAVAQIPHQVDKASPARSAWGEELLRHEKSLSWGWARPCGRRRVFDGPGQLARVPILTRLRGLLACCSVRLGVQVDAELVDGRSLPGAPLDYPQVHRAGTENPEGQPTDAGCPP